MPVKRTTTTRPQDRRSNDPNYNARIVDALARVASGEFKSFNQAAEHTNVRYNKTSILRLMPFVLHKLDSSLNTHRQGKKSPW